MKKLIFAIAIVSLLLAGCLSSGTYVPPAVCDGSESVILGKFPDPRGLDKSLLTVQLVALEKIDGYNKSDAIEVLDDIQDKIEAGLTYADLVTIIQEKVKIGNALAGGAIFIVGADIGVLAEPLPISDCDLALIEKHLEKQKVLIKIYQEQ